MADRRPDLEALPYKRPPFIWRSLFPGLKRLVKAGRLYFRDIVSDGSAQTDRTLGEAPTAARIDSANTTWALAEKIIRRKIDGSEIEQLGGLAAAQQVMARVCKRAVGGTIESLAIAATFGDTDNITNADIGSSFLAALDTGKEAIEDYADGRIALFGSRKVVNRLKRYNEVVERMKFTGVLVRDIRDVRNISDEQLAAAIGVDTVLAGPSSTSYWFGAESAYDGYLGLAVLPDPDVTPLEEVQLGRVLYMPIPAEGDPDNAFQVETYYSDDLKSEVLDCTAWVALEALNKECCYIFTGVDEENAVTGS